MLELYFPQKSIKYYKNSINFIIFHLEIYTVQSDGIVFVVDVNESSSEITFSLLLGTYNN